MRVTSFSPHLTHAEKQVREAQTHPEAAELRQRQSWDVALLHLTTESLLSASPAPTLPARHQTAGWEIRRTVATPALGGTQRPAC